MQRLATSVNKSYLQRSKTNVYNKPQLFSNIRRSYTTPEVPAEWAKLAKKEIKADPSILNWESSVSFFMIIKIIMIIK